VNSPRRTSRTQWPEPECPAPFHGREGLQHHSACTCDLRRTGRCSRLVFRPIHLHPRPFGGRCRKSKARQILWISNWQVLVVRPGVGREQPISRRTAATGLTVARATAEARNFTCLRRRSVAPGRGELSAGCSRLGSFVDVHLTTNHRPRAHRQNKVLQRGGGAVAPSPSAWASGWSQWNKRHDQSITQARRARSQAAATRGYRSRHWM